MKLRTLAMAIAAASISVSASAADLKISGDITVGYQSEDRKVDEDGSEINFDVSEKLGGTTFYSHVEVDAGGNNNSADFEEFRVGAKGKWGEVIIGEVDNACDKLDTGGQNDIFLTHEQGRCEGSDEGNIVFLKTFGKTKVAASYRATRPEQNVAFGIQSKLPGNLTVSAGYEHGAEDKSPSGEAVEGNNFVLGLKKKMGPLTLSFDGSSFSSDSYFDNGVEVDLGSGEEIDYTKIGVNFLYEVGANKFIGGMGKVSSDESFGTEVEDRDQKTYSLAYQRALTKKSIFVAEYLKYDHADDEDRDDRWAIGFRQKF
ncbi:porin [Leucothrix sargassi]|nr:porin [Leucothrix sargassi]